MLLFNDTKHLYFWLALLSCHHKNSFTYRLYSTFVIGFSVFVLFADRQTVYAMLKSITEFKCVDTFKIRKMVRINTQTKKKVYHTNIYCIHLFIFFSLENRNLLCISNLSLKQKESENEHFDAQPKQTGKKGLICVLYSQKVDKNHEMCRDSTLKSSEYRVYIHKTFKI